MECLITPTRMSEQSLLLHINYMNIVLAISTHSDTKRRHNNYVYIIYSTKYWEILSVITELQTICAVCTILYQKKKH